MSGNLARAVCVAIDFETSGKYGYSACAIGMARIENLEVVDKFYSLIRPPSSRIWFTNVHGLRWKDLKDQPAFAEVWQEAGKFLAGADYLVAHNASFDRNVLYSCCDEFNQEIPWQPFLCTLRGAKKVLELPSFALGCVCSYFGIELNHHHAGSDATGCARIFTHLVKRGLGAPAMELKSKFASRSHLPGDF